ncbi:hypothetical protein JB92DRAFT_2827334 [Gautieria morchelliformis]|nr:hypothetical protein JB92DRAFT_2827334 [Gautieria morchelliformis]
MTAKQHTHQYVIILSEKKRNPRIRVRSTQAVKPRAVSEDVNDLSWNAFSFRGRCRAPCTLVVGDMLRGAIRWQAPACAHSQLHPSGAHTPFPLSPRARKGCARKQVRTGATYYRRLEATEAAAKEAPGAKFRLTTAARQGQKRTNAKLQREGKKRRSDVARNPKPKKIRLTWPPCAGQNSPENADGRSDRSVIDQATSQGTHQLMKQKPNIGHRQRPVPPYQPFGSTQPVNYVRVIRKISQIS